MNHRENIADHPGEGDAEEAIAAKQKRVAEERLTAHLVRQVFQGIFFVLFATGAFGRLVMAASAEGFYWKLWLNLGVWVCAGALYFGFLRPGR